MFVGDTCGGRPHGRWRDSSPARFLPHRSERTPSGYAGRPASRRRDDGRVDIADQQLLVGAGAADDLAVR